MKDHLKKLVEEFLAAAPSIRPVKSHEYAIEEVYPAHHGDEWRDAPGVYYFAVGDEVKYVGMSASAWGMGWRVYKALNWIGLTNSYPAAPMQEWTELLNSPESKVGMFQFEKSDWYWPLSLEALLVERLHPELNNRKLRPPVDLTLDSPLLVEGSVDDSHGELMTTARARASTNAFGEL